MRGALPFLLLGSFWNNRRRERERERERERGVRVFNSLVAGGGGGTKKIESRPEVSRVWEFRPLDMSWCVSRSVSLPFVVRTCGVFSGVSSQSGKWHGS